MSGAGVRVLLLGASASGASYLQHCLERRGCHCWFATSAEEGAALDERYAFHLILTTSPANWCNLIVDHPRKSKCSVFRSYPVEDSCLWLPLVNHGEKCPGTPALRPSEFISVLDQIVKEIESQDTAAAMSL